MRRYSWDPESRDWTETCWGRWGAETGLEEGDLLAQARGRPSMPLSVPREAWALGECPDFHPSIFEGCPWEGINPLVLPGCPIHRQRGPRSQESLSQEAGAGHWALGALLLYVYGVAQSRTRLK